RCSSAGRGGQTGGRGARGRGGGALTRLTLEGATFLYSTPGVGEETGGGKHEKAPGATRAGRARGVGRRFDQGGGAGRRRGGQQRQPDVSGLAERAERARAGG